ncbi:MAG: N-acetyltransferase [Dehalococcoidales bacterium]|nr:N-acetyltransferase [Dehalococcoidales bacterium]
MLIRPATIEDIAAITDIYNEAILTTDATFDIEPKTIEQQTTWFYHHGSRNPVLVAEKGSMIIGWASLSKWSDRAAYDDTVELSVYVGSAFRGQGIGRRLMEEILEKCRDIGLHTVLSRIVAGNKESLHLHAALGFETVGIMREVGKKNGRLLDVHILQKLYPGISGTINE